jgi:putative transcriptional regulator
MAFVGGSLLIAGASLWDPNFRKTVVLIGHHDEDGAVGVVLNRVSDHEVVDAAPPLAPLVAPGERLFLGGPVQPEAAVVVADFERPDVAQVLAFGSIGFMPPETDADELGPLRRARVFAGYAGWGPGQLEAELERDDWIVVNAVEDDVFDEDAPTLWSRVLDRQGGKMRLIARMPLDPTLN